jgi:hypothetical protein
VSVEVISTWWSRESLCGEIRGVSNVRKSSSGRDFEKELKRERMSGREASSVVAIAPVDILKAVDDGA